MLHKLISNIFCVIMVFISIFSKACSNGNKGKRGKNTQDKITQKKKTKLIFLTLKHTRPMEMKSCVHDINILSCLYTFSFSPN